MKRTDKLLRQIEHWESLRRKWTDVHQFHCQGSEKLVAQADVMIAKAKQERSKQPLSILNLP